MNTINQSLILDAKLNKQLFDLCIKNEGEKGNLHVLNQSDIAEEEYRVYHADGYCFDIKKSKVDLAEHEINISAIEGYEYEFYYEWEGFKELTIDEAINLF